MKQLNSIVRDLIENRRRDVPPVTLLAVCPNSEAVLEAAVKAAACNQSIMLFAATLNQVDTDGGYTGWTPREFVGKMRDYADKYEWDGSLYPCLDHGGPWLKDRDTRDRLSYEQTMDNVKQSIEACLRAGYALLHIDPTVDRTLKPGPAIAIETVVDRTVELIDFAENIRAQHRLPEISYEVGTEEVHGGMVDLSGFDRFIALLRDKMEQTGLSRVWPCFFVAQVGTDLHTTEFDREAAQAIYQRLHPLGSLAKGHYTDWAARLQDYPQSGMGGANVGPEFAAEEFNALADLSQKENALLQGGRRGKTSDFMVVLRNAVIGSGRWQKWLEPQEAGLGFDELSRERQLWLLQTGSRYIWTLERVVAARAVLYRNLSEIIPDPNRYVVDRIAGVIDKYINRFNLFGSQRLLG
jgi:tagatose-1,6-bisphosphate aldolase non-catalytic subunit AgaZ/GatZ